MVRSDHESPRVYDSLKEKLLLHHSRKFRHQKWGEWMLTMVWLTDGSYGFFRESRYFHKSACLSTKSECFCISGIGVGVRDPPIQGFNTDSIKIKAFNFSTVLKFPFLALDPVAAFASQPQSSTEHGPIIDMLLHTCFLHFHSSPLNYARWDLLNMTSDQLALRAPLGQNTVRSVFIVVSTNIDDISRKNPFSPAYILPQNGEWGDPRKYEFYFYINHIHRYRLTILRRPASVVVSVAINDCGDTKKRKGAMDKCLWASSKELFIWFLLCGQSMSIRMESRSLTFDESPLKMLKLKFIGKNLTKEERVTIELLEDVNKHMLQRYRASNWAIPLIRCDPTQPMVEPDRQGSGSHRLNPPIPPRTRPKGPDPKSGYLRNVIRGIRTLRYPRPHWAQTNPRQFWAEAQLLKHAARGRSSRSSRMCPPGLEL
ncbi:hypothetical protein OSB04_027528, partial [Centaurea solstitialis]